MSEKLVVEGKRSDDGALGRSGKGPENGQCGLFTKVLPFDAVLVQYVLLPAGRDHSGTHRSVLLSQLYDDGRQCPVTGVLRNNYTTSTRVFLPYKMVA